MRIFEQINNEEQKSVDLFNQKRKQESFKHSRVIKEAKNLDVIETFVLDFYVKDRLKTKNLYIVDLGKGNYALYNYTTKIAERNFFGANIETQWEILIESSKFSSSTSAIQNAIKGVCERSNVPYKYVRFSENESLLQKRKEVNEKRIADQKEKIQEAKNNKNVGFAIKVGDFLEDYAEEDGIEVDWDEANKDISQIESNVVKLLGKYFGGKARDEGHNDDELVGSLINPSKNLDSIVDVIDRQELLSTSSGSIPFSDKELYKNTSDKYPIDVSIDFFNPEGFPELESAKKDNEVKEAKKPEISKPEIKEALNKESLDNYRLASKIDSIIEANGEFSENSVEIKHKLIEEFSTEELAIANYKIKSIEQNHVDPSVTLVLCEEKAGNVANFGDKKAKPFKKESEEEKDDKEESCSKDKKHESVDIEDIKKRQLENKINSGMLKKWVSSLMGSDKKTSNYSLYRKLYDDLDKENEWESFSKEIDSKKIKSEADFDKYIKNGAKESAIDPKFQIKEEVDGILGANKSASFTGAIDFVTSGASKVSRDTVNDYLRKHYQDPVVARNTIDSFVKAEGTDWNDVSKRIIDDRKIESYRDVKESYRHNKMDDLIEDIFGGDYTLGVQSLVKQMSDDEFNDNFEFIARMNDLNDVYDDYQNKYGRKSGNRNYGLDIMMNYFNSEEIYNDLVSAMSDKEFKDAEKFIIRMNG